MIRIVPLVDIDPVAIEALLDASFGADRHSRTAYKIRAGMQWLPLMSFAAIDEMSMLLGTLQSWPIALHNEQGAAPLTLIGPVAVTPEHQRAGIGRRLMEALMTAAAARVIGSDAMVMIGDPEYYGRFFGFTADVTAEWDVPGPVERRRLLAKISRNGGLPARGLLGPLQAGTERIKQSDAAHAIAP